MWSSSHVAAVMGAYTDIPAPRAFDGLPGHWENRPGAPHRDCPPGRRRVQVKIITKTNSSVQNFGMQMETADHWARSTVRKRDCNIDWPVAEEITQLDRRLPLFPANHGQLRGHPGAAGAQALPAAPRPWHHELTENMRSDPGIFDFVTWLRVDEPRTSTWAPAGPPAASS